MNNKTKLSYKLYGGSFMLIFNKKRILIIFICLMISISFTKIKEKNKTIETVALPVENKVIVIDARTWNTR